MKKVLCFIAAFALMVAFVSGCSSPKKAQVNRDGEYLLVEMEKDDIVYDKSAIDSTGVDLSVTINGTEARMISKYMDADNEMTFDPDRSLFTLKEGDPIVVSFEAQFMRFSINGFDYKLEKQ